MAKNDVESLCIKIMEIFINPSFYNDQAKFNLYRFSDYRESVLQSKRETFIGVL